MAVPDRMDEQLRSLGLVEAQRNGAAAAAFTHASSTTPGSRGQCSTMCVCRRDGLGDRIIAIAEPATHVSVS